MEQMVQLISNYGTSVILMAYFLYKDYKFNGTIINLLGKVEKVLVKLTGDLDAE